MRPGLALAYALREARGAAGRLAFFAACLAVGVAAVVAVAGLSDALERGIEREARTLLAADLKVSSRRALPAELAPLLARLGALERADLLETATVVAEPPAPDGTPGRSQLAQLKVVEGGYPFYGELRLDPPLAEGESLATRLGEEGTLVDPVLAERLGLELGDTMRIGSASFTLRGTVLAEPDRVMVGFALAPRVFIAAAGFPRTELEGLGSRVEYDALVRMPEETSLAELRAARRAIKEELPDSGYVRVETWADAQPQLRRGLFQVERFLGLIALLSLIVGGVGVAQAVRAWLASRLDAIAVLRCLGLTPRAVLALYALQAMLLGLAGSLVGALLGSGLLALTPSLLGDLVRADLIDPWQPFAVARGLALGVAVALLFSLPALLAAVRVPPVRVFRREAEPLPAPRAARAGQALFLVAGVFLVASAQSSSWGLGAGFTAGLIVVFGLLSTAALGLVRLVRLVPTERLAPSTRHGLSALARPGAATMGAIVALGVGVTVVLAMALVERRLSAQLGAEVPADAPSAFLVDIQPDQWEGLSALLRERGARDLVDVPMVVGRLRSIDGRPVDELVGGLAGQRERGERRWALTREQRMTYLEELPGDNELLEGELWSEPGVDEISVEEDFASDIGAALGSLLTFDVQGVAITMKVTSLRRVDWGSFGVNFFLVAEPEAVRDAPQVRVATVRIPEGREAEIQDAVAAAYPNVTLVRVREVLERVVTILERLALGVRLLGGFAVLAGLAILGGAVTASTVRRRREVAIYKTLGMTRAGVVGLFSVEFALVGAVAGLIGAAAGLVLAWSVVVEAFDLEFVLEAGPLLFALLASALLSVLGGLAASVGVLRAPPAVVLKAE